MLPGRGSPRGLSLCLLDGAVPRASLSSLLHQAGFWKCLSLCRKKCMHIYIYIYIHIYIYIYIYVYTHIDIQKCAYRCTHTSTHAYTKRCTYTIECMHSVIRTVKSVCIRDEGQDQSFNFLNFLLSPLFTTEETEDQEVEEATGQLARVPGSGSRCRR